MPIAIGLLDIPLITSMGRSVDGDIGMGRTSYHISMYGMELISAQPTCLPPI
jgi:hypothetical protein